MHFLLLTKGSHENINFDTFKCSDENFLMSVFLQIWHDSLVSWYITPLYFFRSKVTYFAQKGPIKVTKFLSFLKQKISFSSNFAPLFGIMRHISSKLYILLSKVAYQSTNLVKLHLSSQKSEMLHCGGLLLRKSYKISAKKVEKTYLPWHWRVMESIKKNWLEVSNMRCGTWWIFTQPLKSPKISLQWAVFFQIIWVLS